MTRCPFCDQANPQGATACKNCGAALAVSIGEAPDPPRNLEAAVRVLLDEGRKIEAIKLYRDETGAGLKEAKDAVEAVEVGRPLERVETIGGTFETTLISLLKDGRKIEAIKLFRDQTGAGLKEAKDAVEAIARSKEIPQASKNGCLGSVLFLLSVSIATLALLGAAHQAAGCVAEATIDKDGFLVHKVQSEYQADTTEIRVLLPEPRTKGQKYPVVYVLPVEAGRENRYGDGLTEVKNLDLANRHQAIFVAPTFSHLPWYADHPTDPKIRQESYFLKTVIPLVENHYPASAGRHGRFLLGFSKSGWGAFSLILRHPDTFERAAAWDAPLMMSTPGKYGSGEIFGTNANFSAYQVTSLLERSSKAWKDQPRLILTGIGNFDQDHKALHALMDRLSIPHVYRNTLLRKHHWQGGWLAEAVELLLADPGKGGSK